MNSTHLYYNIEVYNNQSGYDGSGNQINTTRASVISYIENRANAYLDNPSDYDLSVMSFTFDNNYLPLQIVQPLLGGTFTNVGSLPFILSGFPTVYALAVYSTTASSSITNVFWKPSDATLQIAEPITVRDINNEYFWNYEIGYFLTLINQSIGYAILEIEPTETVFPYFEFNSTISRIIFNATSKFIAGDYNLIINEPLQALLGGFNYVYNTYGFSQGYYRLITTNKNYTNVVIRNNNDPLVPPSSDTPYFQQIQEYNTIQNWNPVSNMLFVSPVLPVVNEMIANPLITGTSNIIRSNNADTLNILFDFVISQQDNPETSFVPAGQYVLTSLIGVNPISELQVIMMWRDTFGNVYPLKLEAGSGLNLKILFRKKDFSRKEISE